MKLYSYFRSSAAYRVRIALNLKGLDHEVLPVHLLRDGGEQHQADYRRINPAGLVPALDVDGMILTQSLAIIEFLDESWPEPPLLPSSLHERAMVRAIAQTIACDIHPLNNLRVLQRLTRDFGATDAQKNAWYRHWVETGLETVEALLASCPHDGRFCLGDSPTLADICLVPQVFNARRFHCGIDHLPHIARVVGACEALEAFIRAAPERQPDAQ